MHPILIDLSKAYDFLPRKLLIVKLEAYGIVYNSLTFMLDYPKSRK